MMGGKSTISPGEPFALRLFLSEVWTQPARTGSGSDEEAGVEGGTAMGLASASGGLKDAKDAKGAKGANMV